MEIFKGDAGIRVTVDEVFSLIEHDMLDDMIKVIVTLDSMDITIEELAELLGQSREVSSIEQFLESLYKTKEEDGPVF